MNEAPNRFCITCGSSLTAKGVQHHDHSHKREKVLKKRQLKGIPWKPVVSVAAVVVIIAGVFVVRNRPEKNTAIASQPKVIEGVDYGGQVVKMVEIASTVEDGKIAVPLDVVTTSKLVRFVYNDLPLVAYLTPSGRVITGVSMCEPCRSTRFHIQDEMMVCNSCETRWTLEDLEGVSGGCLNYPPDVIPSTVAGGK
ncbi:MAG: DUF2318 domain-containing protein, partial [Candidatus Latescibacteria bacterium]|nr:DUF2318 domain-containing protein [Candidatus Latescibacterota bacterium]